MKWVFFFPWAKNKVIGKDRTSAPVFAAISTASRSCFAGIGPGESAPIFEYRFSLGNSDITALVQNLLIGRVRDKFLGTPRSLNPIRLEANLSKLNGGESLWCETGFSDLGIWENLSGIDVEEIRDRPIGQDCSIPLEDMDSTVWMGMVGRVLVEDGALKPQINHTVGRSRNSCVKDIRAQGNGEKDIRRTRFYYIHACERHCGS